MLIYSFLTEAPVAALFITPGKSGQKFDRVIAIVFLVGLSVCLSISLYVLIFHRDCREIQLYLKVSLNWLIGPVLSESAAAGSDETGTIRPLKMPVLATDRLRLLF